MLIISKPHLKVSKPADKIPTGNESPTFVHVGQFSNNNNKNTYSKRPEVHFTSDSIKNYMLWGQNAKLDSSSDSNKGGGVYGNLLPPKHISLLPLTLSSLQTSLLSLPFSSDCMVQNNCCINLPVNPGAHLFHWPFIVMAVVRFCLVHRWRTTWNYGDHPGLRPTTALFVCR